MALLNANTKEKLKASGHWAEFMEVREQKKLDGATPKDALAATLAEFGPKIEAWERDGVNAAPIASAEKGEGVVEGLRLSECCPDSGAAPLPKPPPEPPPEPTGPRDVHEWLERKCDITVAIEWVAKRMELPDKDIDIEDAPSAEAWGLLMNYRSSLKDKSDFWEKMYAKLIPTKSQLDNRAPVDLDGSDIISACSTLAAIAEAVRKKETEPLGGMEQDGESDAVEV